MNCGCREAMCQHVVPATLTREELVAVYKARIKAQGDEIERLQLELAHKERYYAQFDLTPKPNAVPQPEQRK